MKHIVIIVVAFVKVFMVLMAKFIVRIVTLKSMEKDLNEKMIKEKF
ncbi:MAG: hypothetical protein HDR51_05030 [Treponema sp.]|nr:hypothetical protein [Treponema sp.]